MLESRSYLANVAFGSPTVIASIPQPLAAISGDFLGTHQTQLIVSNVSGSSNLIQLLEPNSNGTFTASTIFQTESPVTSLTVGDFNGNGPVDFVAGFGPLADLFINNLDGTFTATTIPLETSFISAIAVGDLNGDGLSDVVIAGSGGVNILLNNGDGGFDLPVPVPDPGISGSSAPAALTLANVNNDGNLDLIVGNAEASFVSSGVGGNQVFNGTLNVLKGNGDGSFALTRAVPQPLKSKPIRIVVGDLNGDRRPDIAVAESDPLPGNAPSAVGQGGTLQLTSSGRVELFDEAADGSFSPQADLALPSTPLDIVADDFNLDGHLDLAVASADGTIQLVQGNASGTTGPAAGVTVAAGAKLTSLLSTDLTGDGSSDLIVTDVDGGKVYRLADVIPPISAPDPTFGSAGEVTLKFSASAVGTDAQQRALCAGSTASSNGDYDAFVLARYSTSGVQEFRAVADFGTDAHATGVTAEPNGKILLVGFVTDGRGKQHVAVAQFTADGKLDASFGNNGTEIGPIVKVSGGSLSFAAAVQTNGKIVIADGLGTKFSITRYNADLTPDPNFGSNGHVTTTFSIGNSTATALLVQPDGKIVAGGVIGEHFALARFNVNGTLDNTFGDNGEVTAGIVGLAGVTDLRYEINPRFPGNITALGYIAGSGTNPPRPVLIRFDPNGARSRRFGTRGEVISPDTGVSGQSAHVLHASPAAAQTMPDLALDAIGRIFEVAATHLDRVQGVFHPKTKARHPHTASPAASLAGLPLASPALAAFSTSANITPSNAGLSESAANDSVLESSPLSTGERGPDDVRDNSALHPHLPGRPRIGVRRSGGSV